MNNNSKFFYSTGEEVKIGDTVLYEEKYTAIVELIIIPGSESSKGFEHIKEPAFFIRGKEIGAMELGSTTDDCYDLKLISRSF